MIKRDVTLLVNDTVMQDKSDTITNPIPQLFPEYLCESTDTPKVDIKNNNVGGIIIQERPK